VIEFANRLVDATLKRGSLMRRVVAWVLAVAGSWAIALGLIPIRAEVGLDAVLLCSLILVMVVAAIGGLWPALVTALLAFVADELFFTPPYDTLSIRPTSDRVAVIVFVVVGSAVGTVVGILIGRLSGLANQQGALRRVATLVAQAAPSERIFGTATEEAGHLLRVDLAMLHHYESDGTVRLAASWGRTGRPVMIGTSSTVVGGNVDTGGDEAGRSKRMKRYVGISALIAESVRESGASSAVGTPISVEGRFWGVMVVASTKRRPLPSDTQTHLAAFANLVAISIANAESRAEVAASRARVVATADETRRRIERDLHDGPQQRLIAVQMELRSAERLVPPDSWALGARLSRAVDDLHEVGTELQQLSRGLHPAILSRGGLVPALGLLARRSAVPVELDVRIERRLPDWIEIATFYVVSEALSNAAKHARASMVRVQVEEKGSRIELFIHDDGMGGADPSRGSGLMGIKDRIESFGGQLEIESADGAGTTLHVVFPDDAASGEFVGYPAVPRQP
jgi:signal transduction histidine kinase